MDLQTSTLLQIVRTLEYDLVMVHRTQLSMVEAIQSGDFGKTSQPMYQLSDEGEGDVNDRGEF